MLVFSCNTENNDEQLPAANNGTIYKISELPELPEFAKPISKSGEIRRFTLVKKDGVQLNFELKSTEGTVFGKQRTLIGTVRGGDKTPENAVMVLGENGFELSFKDQKEDFIVKGRNVLDVGYVAPGSNLDSATKKEFLAYARKNGLDSKMLLDNVKKKQVNNDRQYDVVIEKSKNYNLINETITLKKKEAVESAMGCSFGLFPPSASKQSYSKKADLSKKVYTIEIMYMESSYDFANQYIRLVFSLFFLHPGLGNVAVLQYRHPEIKQVSDIRKWIERYFAYMEAFTKVSDSNDQLGKMTGFNSSYPGDLNKSVVRCALYEEGWSEGVLGKANLDAYGPYFDSTLIACDNQDNILAHECGHNLGAIHVDNKSDLMYAFTSPSSLGHFDSSNIAKIKSKFGL